MKLGQHPVFWVFVVIWMIFGLVAATMVQRGASPLPFAYAGMASWIVAFVVFRRLGKKR